MKTQTKTRKTRKPQKSMCEIAGRVNYCSNHFDSTVLNSIGMSDRSGAKGTVTFDLDR